MTIRHKLADWLSGGELTRAGEALDLQIEDACHWFAVAGKRRDALRAIIACETENANGTVRRMARIAKEGLQ